MNMNYRKSISLAAVLSVWIALPASAIESMPIIIVTPKPASSMHHEFTLESGESLRLAHLHNATYRFCVNPFAGSVPIKVFADGAESTVDVGSCETVTGNHINVEPAAPLPGGDYLVARYQRISSK
jgi:hypothetical protein